MFVMKNLSLNMENSPAAPAILDGNGIKLAVGQGVMDLIFEPTFQENWLALYHHATGPLCFRVLTLSYNGIPYITFPTTQLLYIRIPTAYLPA